MLPKFKCANPKCKKVWTPRKDEPRVCPKCNSAYWNDTKHWGLKK